MATRGTDVQEKFDPESESITSYLERVDYYFTANGVEDAKKVAVFLNAIGRETYNLLRNLLAPKKLAEQGLDELQKALKDHYEPQTVVVAERFHFYQRQQAAGESISDYVAELRKLAIHCDFKDNLDDALRDKFICGLSKEPLKGSCCQKRS